MVNAYILAFGALMLLGGRIGGLHARRRALHAGSLSWCSYNWPAESASIATTFSEYKTLDAVLSLWVQCPA
jgi:hypothetical protein